MISSEYICKRKLCKCRSWLVLGAVFTFDVLTYTINSEAVFIS